MEKTNCQIINEALVDTQDVLNNYFLALESTIYKYEEVRFQATQHQAKHLSLPQCNAIKDLLRGQSQICTENIETLFAYKEVLNNVKCKLQKSLKCFNTDEPPMIVKYQSGDPWCLTLKQTPCKNKNIERLLLEMCQSKKLENITTGVDILDLVCVQEGRTCYRAVVIDNKISNDCLAVLNIDKNYRKVIPMKNVYEMPFEIMEIPIQVIRCNLIPESEHMKSFWGPDAANLFLSVTSESTLSVTITGRIEGEMLPLYSVKLTAENNGVQIDLNSWLTNKVLPMLGSWKIKRPSFEEVGVLFPFKTNTPAEDTKLTPNKTFTKSGKSMPKAVKNSQNSVDSRDNMADDIYVTDNIYVADKKLFSDTDPEVKNYFSNTPSLQGAIVVPTGNEEVSVISYHDDEYEPQDESRLCPLYLRNKRCWKTNCKKLHKRPTGKWTDDTVDTHCIISNKVRLPELFEELTFKVVEVFSVNSFYVYLHPDYSRTDDSDYVESLKTLEKDMNSIENAKKYESYTVEPSICEILLVQDDKKGYKRAKVVDIFDQSVYVFFVDYGYYETVPLTNIRKICKQFLHLPEQAILTFLSNTMPVLEKAQEGKAFTKLKLKEKVFRAKVTRRNVIDGELSVELYLYNGTCLNEVLVQKGYCKTP